MRFIVKISGEAHEWTSDVFYHRRARVEGFVKQNDFPQAVIRFNNVGHNSQQQDVPSHLAKRESPEDCS